MTFLLTTIEAQVEYFTESKKGVSIIDGNILIYTKIRTLKTSLYKGTNFSFRVHKERFLKISKGRTIITVP